MRQTILPLLALILLLAVSPVWAAGTLMAHGAPVAPGGNVTATWSGVSPRVLDWVGLYQVGATDQQYLAWAYTSSCTHTPGSQAKTDGSCSLLTPTSAQGDHELRLFIDGSYNRHAVSDPFAIGEMIAGVPLCYDHDATVWHTTVRRDAAGAIICTYGHEHGDDPQQGDVVFGPVNAYYGGSQTISYPWATSMENQMKHWFYKYLVRRDLGPLTAPDFQANQGRYFKNFRAVGHFEGFSYIAPDGMKMGFPVQYHSYAFEGEICRADGVCGILRVGGWQDYGKGVISTATQGDVCYLPDAFDNTCTSPRSNRRIHGGWPINRRDFTWYGGGNGIYPPPGETGLGVGLGIIGEATGWVDPNDLATFHPIPPNATDYGRSYIFGNGSWYQSEVIGTVIPVALDPDGDGLVTWSGYTTRWGVTQPVGACLGETGQPTPGLDCVPTELVNVPVGTTLYRDGAHRTQYGNQGSYDGGDKDVVVDDPTSPYAKKRSLIRFPN